MAKESDWVGGVVMIAEVVLVCLFLTAHAVQCLNRLWHRSLERDQQQRQRKPRMSQFVRRLTGAFELGDNDGLHAYALRKLSQRLCVRAREWSNMNGKYQCLCALLTISNMASGKPRWMTTGQDFLQIGFLAMSWLATVAPRTINISTLNIWYVVLSFGVTLFCSLARENMFLTVAYLVYLPRVVFGLMSTRLRVVIAMNIVHTAVVCYTYWRLEAPAHGSCARLDTTTFALIEAPLGVFVVLFVHVWRKSSYDEIRRDAEANSLQRENSATQRLLGLMCDVVLVLDEELCFVEHVPKFAAIFLFGANQCVKGVKLSDYMPIEYDRERLKYLTDEASACEDDDGALCGPMPGAMHATMRASEDAKVSVEIFYVKYREFGGALRYLVGIHEVADQPIPDLFQFPISRKSTGRSAAATASTGTPPTRSESALDSTSTSQGKEAPPWAQAPRPATQPEQAAADAGVLGDQARPQLDRQAPLSRRRSRSSGSGASSWRSSPSSSLGSSAGAGIRGPSRTTAGGRFRLTTTRAKDLTTIASMLTWNVPLPDSACCSFHAALSEYQKTVARLKNSRCVPNYMHDWAAQCQECGVMCGWDLEKGSAGEPLRCECCQCPAVRKISRQSSLRTTEP